MYNKYGEARGGTGPPLFPLSLTPMIPIQDIYYRKYRIVCTKLSDINNLFSAPDKLVKYVIVMYIRNMLSKISVFTLVFFKKELYYI